MSSVGSSFGAKIGLVALLTPIPLLLLFRLAPKLDLVYLSLPFHFWTVTLTTGAATFALTVVESRAEMLE